MAKNKAKYLSIRLSPSELRRIVAAADSLTMPGSAWVRHQALRAAEGASKPPPLHQAFSPGDLSAKRTRTLRTRLTEQQCEALAAHARACGLTVSGFIRQLILGFKPMARRPLARSAIVAVNRVGTNLNHLVQLASSGVVLTPDLMLAVAGAMDTIHSLRDALLRADATGASGSPE
jgi:uncharacterized protein (DUF1778 family)